MPEPMSSTISKYTKKAAAWTPSRPSGLGERDLRKSVVDLQFMLNIIAYFVAVANYYFFLFNMLIEINLK